MNSKKTVAVATLGLLAGCGGTTDLSNSGTTPYPELANAPSADVTNPTDTTNPGDSTGSDLASAPSPSGLSETHGLRSDLRRLAQLNIVDVGRLVHDYPEGAMNCYGPCPGFEDEIAEEEARQAERLQDLLAIANEASSVTLDSDSCTVEVIDENLAALDGLDIVEVFGLVEEVPQNNPYCYNLPCSEDIEAAEEINCQRATALATIVAEATEL